MFISEKELINLRNSYLYKDFPFALIFFRELKRKQAYSRGKVESHLFHGYFNRFLPDSNSLEVLFPDNSTLVFDFSEQKIYVFHPRSCFADTFDFA